MKYKIGFLVLILTFVSGYAGFTSYNDSAESKVISVHAAWGDEFADVKSLSKSSDIIVLATLKEELNSYQPFEDLEDTFTDASINVEKIIKGDKNINEVLLSQYGGIRPDGRNEVFEELPLLEEEKKYLLFLEYIEEDSERGGKYQTLGGVQGYYIIPENIGIYSSDRKEIESIVNGEINKKVTDYNIEELIELNKSLE